MIGRYTRHTVVSWVFEIRYDVEHRTGAGKLPFEELYLTTYHCIRSLLPEARIGSSELNAEMNYEVLKNQLCWWKGIEERPDFLSFMCYPYRVRQETDGENPHLLDIRSDTHFVKETLEEYQSLLEEVDYPKTSIWITEWNTSISERNYYNDSCVKGCHMLSQMTDCVGEVDCMSYMIIGDSHASFFDVKAPITGGTGAVTKDGLRKPAYYALEFWNFLGPLILRKGENYVASMREDGVITVIAFNGQSFNEDYKIKEEDEIGARDLPFLFREKEALNFSLRFKNVRNGKHKISKYRIQESEGNLLAEWGRMGYVETLSKMEIRYLEQICIPRMENSWILVEGGTMDLKLTVEKNEMQMIMIF